jgi:hypothetical protein
LHGFFSFVKKLTGDCDDTGTCNPSLKKGIKNGPSTSNWIFLQEPNGPALKKLKQVSKKINNNN